MMRVTLDLREYSLLGGHVRGGNMVYLALRDSGEAVTVVQHQGVFHGVDGEAIEGRLGPHIALEPLDHGTVHPEHTRRATRTLVVPFDLRLYSISRVFVPEA